MISNLQKILLLTLIKTLIVLILVISVAHIRFPGIYLVMPDVMLILIYYWGVNYDEKILSINFLILLSLMIEMIDNKIFGIVTIFYYIIYNLIVRYRKILLNKSFFKNLYYFSIMISCIFFIKIMILHFMEIEMINYHYLLVKFFLNISFYIVFYFTFQKLYYQTGIRAGSYYE